MRIICSVFAISMLLAGCQAPSTQSGQSLIGKTVEYHYGESVYRVTFNSDSTLYWEAMSGDETGTKENETYVAEWIDPQRLFITWGEANGIGVSQVLDFKQGIVYNHLLRAREASMGNGEIRMLEE